MRTRTLASTLFLLAAVTGCGDDEAADIDAAPPAIDSSNLEAITCDVAIVGGGAGGLHTAFRLAPTLGDGVCLFEKEAELGGRIKDVPMTAAADSPRFGVGARRIMDTQDVLFALATELGMTLEAPLNTGDVVNARGGFALDKDALASRYPGLTLDPDDNDDHESYHYEELMTGTNRANIANYPDFKSYVRGSVGFEEFDFLHDMSRFRADFEYSLDARGYMDYFDEEWFVCCDPSYPIGGMSEFIRRMAAAAEDDGARIFTSEPVVDISRDGTGYRLTTGEHVVTAAKVVIAAPPSAFEWITGDVVDDIKEQEQFQDIIGVKVVTITQWWPNNWWSTIAQTGTPANTIWRAWTTEHCVNFIEIPLDPYSVAQNVTRSVYDDDANCVAFWEDIARNGTAAVEAEVKRGLEHLFNLNGVTSPTSVTIPTPTKTHVEIWPAAWHWLRAGTAFSNAQVFDWSLEPLDGEEVALVGEAYHVNRSGWSDGAYKSSIRLLNEKYGLSLPGLERKLPERVRPRGRASQRRN